MQIASPLAKKKARIEIIPLIDIIFFLLATFVMVSLAMVRQRGMNVHLPEAATGTVGPAPEADVTLTIAADGSLFWNREMVGMEAVRSRLPQLKSTNPEARISLNGDAEARLGDALTLLDAARSAGLTHIQFQTRPVSQVK